jgi:uncharacterized protein (TIGR03435 family)
MRTLLPVAAVLALAGLLSAQSAQDPASPAFEVASVKRNRSGNPAVTMQMQPGGRVTFTNVPLRQLILRAYQLQTFQVVGGPGWITSDRFDIVAKAEGNPTPPEVSMMIRSLLAERFGFVAHNEARELSIYALVLARNDKRLGPSLSASTADCDQTAAGGGRGGAAPPAPLRPGERPTCGMRMLGGQMIAGGMPISQLATSLSPSVQRIVLDRTGLTGNYDFDLTWTPDRPVDGPVDPNGPSIFTALQEQLGLKLESGRGPVDVLVIDRVEPPTEN